MRTREMKTRITFFSEKGGQNEDGEVISPVRKDLYTCWAEVVRTSLKDFQEGAKQSTNKRAKGVIEAEEIKTFYIRHHPKAPFDSSAHVEYNGKEYDIVAIDADENSFDCDKIIVKRRI